VNNVWVRALRRLKRMVNQHSFETWIKSIRYDGYRRGVLRLTVSNESHRCWVNDNYLSLMRVAARDVCKREVDVQVELNGSTEPGKKMSPASRFAFQATSDQIRPRGVLLSPTNGNLTFESFVSGECNEFARAACLKVAQSPAAAYNPLFIFGQPGVGKTHLLCAVAHYIRIHHKPLSVLYQTAEDFTNTLVESIATKQMAGFRAKYRSLDALLIDDVQFIQAKNKTQEVLFYTFNALYDLGRQIVISSDRRPEELHFVQEKLVSRLGSGLVVDLASPDVALKVEILRKKAEKAKFPLPTEIAYYIADRSPSSVRQLEALLTRVKAYAELKLLPLTLDSAKAALNGYGGGEGCSSNGLSVKAIQSKVASYCGLRLENLMSRDRDRNVVRARQIAMYLCRELLGESYPKIGKMFSGMCHAAAIHSHKVVVTRLKTDPVLRSVVDALKKELNGAKPDGGGDKQSLINWAAKP